MSKIILKKYNGRKIDLCDELTRYFLSIKDKAFQAKWLSEYPFQGSHSRQNVSFEFESLNDSVYLVYFSDNIEFNNAFIIETREKKIDDVGIFIPGKKYFWKVKDKITNDESDIDSFTTLNAYIRWISSGSVFNMRDLGGWKVENKKRVKYGLIYRGAQLKIDSKWEKSYMDEYSYKVFDYLKINTEIDLRGDHIHNISQIHDNTNNISINGIGYEQLFTMNEDMKNDYRLIFHALSIKDNYPFYMHCSWGADRTGVLAFLISGLLGVSYDDVSVDYELTSLSNSGRRSRINHPFKFMYPLLKEKYGKDKTFKDLINEYLVDYIGVSQNDIDSIRDIMIEEYTDNNITHNIEYRIDGVKLFELVIFDGLSVPNIDPIISLNKTLKCIMHNNKIYDVKREVHEDLVLDLIYEDLKFFAYDKISLNDLSLGDSYDLREAKNYYYKKSVETGSVALSFDYRVESKDGIFDDGVHIEIGNLWDYKAHVWIQNLRSIHVYSKTTTIPTEFRYNFEYGKVYRIDVGVIIPKNGYSKNQKLFFIKIDNELISLMRVELDLSNSSIGFAGTKGILYNVKK